MGTVRVNKLGKSQGLPWERGEGPRLLRDRASAVEWLSSRDQRGHASWVSSWVGGLGSPQSWA